MKKVINLKLTSSSSQWHGTEKSLLEDKGFQNLKLIFDHLEAKGFCHVQVNGGDYDGSIAKFTLDSDRCSQYNYNNGKLYYSLTGKWFNVKYCWSGRLSWKGKRNNPKFTLMDSTCDVLLNYEGEEILKRFDLKKEGKKLLEEKVFDVDGKVLSINNEVLYLNLRYGSGGKLCHGVVKDFKAHTREGYVSVIISNKDEDEESECRQPYNQIWKKDND